MTERSDARGADADSARFTNGVDPVDGVEGTASRRVISKIGEKGLRASVRIGLGFARQALTSTRRNGRQYVFLAPQIDVTGAPQVLLGAITEFAAVYDPLQIRLVTPHVSPDQVPKLTDLGIRVERTVDVLGSGLIKRQLKLQRPDFVLLNSSAVSQSYRRFVIRSLLMRHLEKAVWLIHEDTEQLSITAPDLLDPRYLGSVRELVDDARLQIFVPSRRAKLDYDDLLGTSEVRTLKLRVEVPKRFRGPRNVDDYGRIDFLLTGVPKDGRKGQLIALFAFQRFLRLYHDEHPERYRPFSLSFVGVGDDYISRQCRMLGTALLGENMRVLPRTSHDDALVVARRCNAVICCSFNEAFPLYIAEGMAMGHVVVRNDVAGKEEQLEEGRNGYLIESDDIAQMADVLESMLNRETTSNEALHTMGQASQAMIGPYIDASYRETLLSS
jgi:glycosyltransferase involved in cell wall biosynthesis